MTLQEVQQVAAVKAENFKLWSVKAYKVSVNAFNVGSGLQLI